MADIDGERLCFIAEWFDALSQITRQYYLNYYVNSKSTEMIDIKYRKLFLKKSKVESVSVDKLYIGSTIHVYCRPLVIIDFGDEYTRKKLGSTKEKALAIIKPDAVSKLGEIISLITENRFLITKLDMCQLTRPEATEFYKEHLGKPYFENLLAHICSGPLGLIELQGSGALQWWRDTIGPTDPLEACKTAPNSLRARYGTDKVANAVHGSKDQDAGRRECQFFFSIDGAPRKSTASFTDCSCCIIKPHAVNAGLTGPIIEDIVNNGFKITMAKMFYLEKANAQEFLEVYRGVLYEYPAMVDELRMGPCVVLEITGDNAPVNFRNYVGPMDPEIGRHLRPHTLRARFGVDKIKNAVHCTDLPEDGPLEVEYFFKILKK